jgi:hypothetical protein
MAVFSGFPFTGAAMRSRKSDDSVEQQPTIATSGEAFSDGTILEWIRDPADSIRSALLSWDGSNGISRAE